MVLIPLDILFHACTQVELGIPGLVEKYSSLQSSIEQRLKWGSGANPSLNVVLQVSGRNLQATFKLLSDACWFCTGFEIWIPKL